MQIERKQHFLVGESYSAVCHETLSITVFQSVFNPLWMHDVAYECFYLQSLEHSQNTHTTIVLQIYIQPFKCFIFNVSSEAEWIKVILDSFKLSRQL